jgi:hypothetical protein
LLLLSLLLRLALSGRHQRRNRKGQLAPGLSTLLRRLGLNHTPSAIPSHATHAAAGAGLDERSPPPILPPFFLLLPFALEAADRLANLDTRPLIRPSRPTTNPTQPSSISVAAKEAWKWRADGGGGGQEDEKEGKHSRVAVMPACLPPLCPYSCRRRHCKAYVRRLTHLYYTHVHTHRTMKPVCLLSLLVAGAAAFHMRK